MNLFDRPLFQPFAQLARDVTRAIIGKQPRLVLDLCAVTAGSHQGKVERVGDIPDFHRGAQLPGNDVSREVVQHRRQIKPAPADLYCSARD